MSCWIFGVRISEGCSGRAFARRTGCPMRAIFRIDICGLYAGHSAERVVCTPVRAVDLFENRVQTGITADDDPRTGISLLPGLRGTARTTTAESWRPGASRVQPMRVH